MSDAMKSQSAIEYLMTYGWAILIIAVVLSVLFQLGVFSSGNFQPHAQAGSCQVSRTVAGVSLEGQCNGMLPEFVGQFNGGSNINLPTTAEITGNQFTMVVWFDELGNGPNAPRALMFSQKDTYIDACGDSGSGVFFQVANSIPSYVNIASPPCPSTGIWQQYVGTYNGQAMTLYVNGVQRGPTADITGNVDVQPIAIGFYSAGGFYVDGYLADVQLYNTSLSASEVQALYLEGIGGAPIRPQNIVGWWPLNGNANDYSGNGNNGQPNGVTFSSSWESGYTAP